MSVHMITYDLNEEGQKYTSLIETIKSLGDWTKVMESCWFVSTNYTVDSMYSTLNEHIDQNDRLLVTKLVRFQYAGFLSQDVIDWLKKEI